MFQEFFFFFKQEILVFIYFPVAFAVNFYLEMKAFLVPNAKNKMATSIGECII